MFPKKSLKHAPNLHNRDVGKLGEDIASSFLSKKGYSILFRNFRSGHDEIDIIGEKGGRLIFFEVKTKVGLALGQPYEAVGAHKLRRLSRAVNYFLLQKRISNTKLSIDIVSIVLNKTYEMESIKHLEDILPTGPKIWSI